MAPRTAAPAKHRTSDTTMLASEADVIRDEEYTQWAISAQKLLDMGIPADIKEILALEETIVQVKARKETTERKNNARHGTHVNRNAYHGHGRVK